MFCLRFLTVLRAHELATYLRHLEPGDAILELGGGTGEQARALADHGFDVVSVDVAASMYKGDRVFPVMDYDGRRLPFQQGSFDVVFSSNVLEHVTDLEALHAEMKRVLKPGGRCIHAMPTGSWRAWTSLANYVEFLQRATGMLPRLVPGGLSRAALGNSVAGARGLLGLTRAYSLPPRHGERGNVVTEIGYFSPRWWRRHFLRHGYRIVRSEPMGLFYTGHMVLGLRLSLRLRERLARWLGSACCLYVVVPDTPTPRADTRPIE